MTALNRTGFDGDDCGPLPARPAAPVGHGAPRLVCAVLTTLHAADDPALWPRAIDSLLGQDIDAEVQIHLCVDGPLPEGHEAMLARYRPRLHRVLRNPRCLGLAAALNRLIDSLGAADLVFRMDGDDISLPGRFRAQAAALAARPELALVGCQAWDIDAAGHRLAPRDFPCDPEAARRLLPRQNPVLHPSWCLRRSLLHDPALRYPAAHLTEDLAFLVLLAARGHRFASLPDRLIEWRVGPAFLNRRRSLRRGLTELVWFARATRVVHGPVSWRYLYAVLRFGLRCLPPSLAARLYRMRSIPAPPRPHLVADLAPEPGDPRA